MLKMIKTVPYKNELINCEGQLPDTFYEISSSKGLNWNGLAVQRVRSESFEVEQHSTPFHGFSLLTSESSVLEVKRGGRSYKVSTRTGQVHIRPANFIVSGRSCSPNDCVQVELDQSRLFDPFSGEALSSEVSFRPQVAIDDPRLRALIEALIAEAEAGGPNGNLFVDSLATALSVHYVSNYAVIPHKEKEYYTKRLSIQQMKRVKEYMDSHVSCALTLDDIAHEMGMSKYYFSRLFKQAAGSTPYQFFISLRIEKARALLDQGKLSLTEIAHQLNFSDQSHFTRIFKKKYGISPRAYLKH